FDVAIELLAGPEPGRIKYIPFDLSSDDPSEIYQEFATNSSTVFAHPAANNASAVAAVPYFNQENPESFTSVGPTTILFESDGTRKATPEIRQTPDIAAIDATDTTFFDSGNGDSENNGFPNFFGTSAAAPHAAAIAALVKQANPTFTPEQIYNRLESTAIDIGTPGYDNVTGHGLINAYDAIFGSVVPTSLNFTDNFEDGDLPLAYETNTNGAGRIQVTTENNPIGTQHLTLDAAFSKFSLNEVILHVNTTRFNDVQLSFDQREFGDFDNPMPETFTGSNDSDGVALSVDGTNWFRLISLTDNNSTETYQTQTFNLSTFAASNNLTLGSDVQIKFQQFGLSAIDSATSPNTSDGFAFDNISVTGTAVNTAPTITSNPTFSVAENTTAVGTITATDADGDNLSFTISGGADQGLFTISNNGELSFNNPPDFETTSDANGDNNYQVTVGVSDGNETITQDVTVSVTNINEAPTANNATFTVDENNEEGTQVGIIDANDSENEALNFVITSGNLDPDNDGNLAFAIVSPTGTITVNDKDDLDFETTPTFNLEVRATEASGLNDTATVIVNLNDIPSATFDTGASQNGFFNLSGESRNLKFALNNVGSSNANEVGLFIVDDENNTIDGIAPGESGYLQAALQKAQVIFSTISQFPNGFELEDVKQVLEIDSDVRLGFYLIANGTTQTALTQLESTGTTDLPVFFSNSSNLQVSELTENGFNLNWSDVEGGSNFTAIQLSVETTDETPAPFTQLQRETQLELLDLTDVTGSVDVEVQVHREAAFDNLIGFYQVVDSNGGIDTNGDGTVDINVGDEGYKQAALNNRITGLDLLATDDGQTATIDGTVVGGSILASFIVVDGTIDQALNDTAQTYFSFLGANSDGVDHIRLLGENTFGYEDLAGGGDNDFNDMIFEIKFPTV
ncbi:MAG: cadherin domain-containing protein, partial [Cyanobacteria bacterium J06641_2]